MSRAENRIAPIAVADVEAGGRPGTRTEYLADLARRHPDRDGYGQLIEYVVIVPFGKYEWRNRRGPFPVRSEAEKVAADLPGSRIVSGPLVTAKGRTVMVVPTRDCRPPGEGEPNYCVTHCTGPACFAQKLAPCCGLCTMHRPNGDPR